jgi:hypothetical protein
MTTKQIIRTSDQYNLDKACRNFAKALDAVSNRRESAVITGKGKTLISVNRTRAYTVKMTVGK